MVTELPLLPSFPPFIPPKENLSASINWEEVSVKHLKSVISTCTGTTGKPMLYPVQVLGS